MGSAKNIARSLKKTRAKVVANRGAHSGKSDSKMLEPMFRDWGFSFERGASRERSTVPIVRDKKACHAFRAHVFCKPLDKAAGF